VEWIQELPTGIGFSLALDQFGSVGFTGGTATVNGATVSIAGTGARALQMANRNDETIAAVSSLGTDGSSFTVTRTNASSDTGLAIRSRESYASVDNYAGRWRARTYRIYIVQDAAGFHIYLMR